MDMLIKNILSNNGWVKECESCCKEINIYIWKSIIKQMMK